MTRHDTTRPCHPSFVFTALVQLGLGWNPTSLGLGLDTSVAVAVAVQLCRQSSAKLAFFFVYEFQSFPEACRYLSETCGKCPWCCHRGYPWSTRSNLPVLNSSLACLELTWVHTLSFCTAVRSLPFIGVLQLRTQVSD